MSKVPLPFTPNGAVSVPIFTRRLNLPEFFTVSGRPLLKLTVTCPKSILLVVMRIRPNGGVGVAVGVRVGVAVAVGVAVGVGVAVAKGVGDGAGPTRAFAIQVPQVRLVVARTEYSAASHTTVSS